MPNQLDSIPSPVVDSVAEVFKPAAELTDTLTVHGVGHVRSLTTYSEMSHGSGHEPEPYVDTPIRSTGTLMMLFTAFLIVAFCYRVGRKYFSTIVENTWSVRRTKNHLDDHTMSETVTMVALIAQALIMEGMIVYCAFFDISSGIDVWTYVGGASIIYVAQLVLFRVIGFIFARHIETDLWIQGFNASQSLMGLLLSPVAIIMLFFPNYNGVMTIVAIIIYLLARIAFLLKSFRVFYNKIFQCFYFILYLCAVEIVPYLIVYRAIFCN